MKSEKESLEIQQNKSARKKNINTILKYAAQNELEWCQLEKLYFKAVEDKSNLQKLQPDKGVRHVDQALEEIYKRENRLISKFDETIKNDTLNPHDNPYVPIKYYSELNDQGKKLDHIKRLETLFDYSESEEGKRVLNLIEVGTNKNAIIQIGEKGSGKTLTQNLFLHKYHDVMEDNKLFWVRCDASKLYTLWRHNVQQINDLSKETSEQDQIDFFEEKTKNNKFISIEEYLLGQVAYVFCKHLRGSKFESKLIIDIYNAIKKSTINEKVILDRVHTKIEQSEERITFPLTENQKHKIKSFTDILDYFQEIIYIDEGIGQLRSGRRARQKSYLIDHIFKPAQNQAKHKYNRALELWLDTGKFLKEFMLNNGYYFMAIVDGIDNVNMDSARSTFLYRNMKQSLRDTLIDNEKGYNEIRWISCRERTEREMHILFKSYNDYITDKVSRNNKWVIQDDVGSLSILIQKRIEYIIQNIKDLGDVNHYKNCIAIEVYKELNKHPHLFDSKLILWHNNLRSMLRNVSNLVRVITFRYYFLNKPENFNIEHQCKSFSKINLLLNGRFYIDNHFNYSNNEGDNFFNLFGAYRIRNEEPLYFLFTRILLFVKREQSGVTESKISNFLSTYFKYTQTEIVYGLEKLRIYGLVDSSIHEQNLHLQLENRKKEIKNDDIIKFKIHEKGKYALKLFYNDIDYLYHTAIASPIPKELNENVSVHSNQLNATKTFYPIHAIKTGVFFLKYLLTIENQSNKYAQSLASTKKNSSKSTLNTIKDLSIRKLIDQSYLSNSIDRLITSCFKDEEYKSLLMEYIKTLS